MARLEVLVDALVRGETNQQRYYSYLLKFHRNILEHLILSKRHLPIMLEINPLILSDDAAVSCKVQQHTICSESDDHNKTE